MKQVGECNYRAAFLCGVSSQAPQAGCGGGDLF